MFCKNCGNRVEDGARYCQTCGTEITATEVNAQPTAGRRIPDDGIIENFFKLHGRLNRKRYIKRSFALAGLALLCFLPFFAVFDRPEQFEALGIALGLVFLIPNYCIDVRRLEDLGYGPAAAVFVLCLGVLYLVLDEESVVKAISYGQSGFWIWLAVQKGTTGKNQYGEDPLQQEA